MSNSRRSDQRLTSRICDSLRKDGGRRRCDEVPSKGEVAEYTMEGSTLETASLKAIRENQATEDAEGDRERKIYGLLRWFSSRSSFNSRIGNSLGYKRWPDDGLYMYDTEGIEYLLKRNFIAPDSHSVS